LALVRPLLNIAGLSDDWGKPATPLLATAAITIIWIAGVVVTRQAKPVLTLVLAGLTYAVLAMAMSGVLSPLLGGELRGPLTSPLAIPGVLAVNAFWGLLAGLIAAAFRRPSR